MLDAVIHEDIALVSGCSQPEQMHVMVCAGEDGS